MRAGRPAGSPVRVDRTPPATSRPRQQPNRKFEQSSKPSMVVVGGLVGGGALGYDVVSGFSQRSDFGKGLAAGAAIVLLGVMLDRITQAAGARRRTPAADTGEPANAQG